MFHKEENTSAGTTPAFNTLTQVSQGSKFTIYCVTNQILSLIIWVCSQLFIFAPLTHIIIPSCNDVTYKLQQADVFSQCSHTTSKSQSKHHYAHH